MRRIRAFIGLTRKATLIGGRAPVWWQGEMQRSTAKLDTLHRACGWVGAWSGIRPLLCSGPLLGHTLQELTGGAVRIAQSDSEGTRAREHQFIGTKYRPAPNQEMALSSDGSVTTFPSRSPATGKSGDGVPDKAKEITRPKTSVSPHIHRELKTPRDWLEDLDRRASFDQPDRCETASLSRFPADLGDQVVCTAESESEMLRVRRPGIAWPEYRPADKRKMAPVSEGSGVVSPQNGPDTAQQRAMISDKTPSPLQMELEASQLLLSRLAGKVAPAEGLSQRRSRSPSITTEPRANLPVPVIRGPEAHREWLHDLVQRIWCTLSQYGLDGPQRYWRVPSDQSGPGDVLSVADQWAIPLNGSPASADLLARLISSTVGVSARSGGETQLEEVPHSPSATRWPDLPGTPAAEDTQSWQPTNPGATGDEQRAVPLTAAEGTGGGRGQSESSTRVAPPNVGPSLSPLDTPELAGKLLSPAATAIVRQNAKQAVVADTEDDLGALAAKIKRILDEEARRHGIDV